MILVTLTFWFLYMQLASAFTDLHTAPQQGHRRIVISPFAICYCNYAKSQERLFGLCNKVRSDNHNAPSSISTSLPIEM